MPNIMGIIVESSFRWRLRRCWILSVLKPDYVAFSTHLGSCFTYLRTKSVEDSNQWDCDTLFGASVHKCENRCKIDSQSEGQKSIFGAPGTYPTAIWGHPSGPRCHCPLTYSDVCMYTHIYIYTDKATLQVIGRLGGRGEFSKEHFCEAAKRHAKTKAEATFPAPFTCLLFSLIWSFYVSLYFE